MTELLVLASLRIEQLALGEPSGTTVRHTGMGPARARIAAARALAHPAPALAVAGVCGGVDPELRAGDVVCATELIGEDGARIPIASAERLVEALRRRNLRVRSGAIASTDRILTPSERRQLPADVVAVDMESVWLAAGANDRPFAVVRVVADEAGRHIADPRTAIGGAKALRKLRLVSDALAEWAAPE
jgi:nucleoside phosphorylase